VEDGDALDLLHVLAVLDVGVAVEQGGAGEADAVEGDPGVVEVVADGLAAHVAVGDARDDAAADAQVGEEGVRAEGLAVEAEVGHHDRLVGDEALGNPVLAGALVGGVEDEALRGGVPGGGGVDASFSVRLKQPSSPRSCMPADLGRI
jgi:hypothetical protein